MFRKLEAAVVGGVLRVVYSHTFESAARHAAFAALGVLAASGGNVDSALVVAAVTAGFRAFQLSLKAALPKKAA